jgi:hypothetical protein
MSPTLSERRHAMPAPARPADHNDVVAALIVVAAISGLVVLGLVLLVLVLFGGVV